MTGAIAQGESIRLIIADDHKIFRNGLQNFLSDIPAITEIAQASNGQEVIDMLEKEKYDMVLLDVEMPVMDGIETTRVLSERFPDVKIIALTMFIKDRYILELYDAGVDGYLLKDADLPELEKAMLMVIQGEQFYCREVSDVLYRTLLKRDKALRDNKGQISPREQEVLKLICDQYSSEEIAEKLFLSPKTVKRHRQILFEKTSSKNLAGLVVYAIKKGIYKVYAE